MNFERWRSRIIRVVVWPVLLTYLSPSAFAIDYQVDGTTASDVIDSRSEMSAPRLVHSSTQPSVLSEVIYQNTLGNSEGYPLGLSWNKGSYGTRTLTSAPAGFSAVTGWGVVYPRVGAPVSANPARNSIKIDRFKTYVHLKTGGWIKVQDQAQAGIGGAHYVADFSRDASIPWNAQKLSDGSVSVDAPPAGYNDHFWPGARGTFTAGTVDGAFVVADMKTTDPGANLVAQIGADWWRDASAKYLYQNGVFVNNPVVGGNNFIKLTTEWQTLYYTSLSPRQLEADPPADLLSNPPPRR